MPAGADAAGAAAGLAGETTGFKLWGKVARPVAAGPVGRNRAPFCPQAASTVTRPAASSNCLHETLTKIRRTFNMAKL